MRIWTIIPILLILSCNQNSLSPYEQSIREFRKDYVNGFLEEDRSPLSKNDLKDLNFFVADSNYRVLAAYSLTKDAEAFDILTSSGKTKSYRKFALLEFVLNDKPFQLSVYESMRLKDMEEYKNYPFLPFTDKSNGEQSYGGGRYMDLDRQDFQNGEIEIDFNKCYNPWCHYSDGYNCPVPPTENDLDIEILAGEMKFSGEYKSATK